jgi:sigma-E factor negative regulatory protein RseC
MLRSGHSGTLCHKGTVRQSNDRSVIIAINTGTACSGCHAEGTCGMTGQTEKIIEINGSYNVRPGDEVTVVIGQSAGFNAVILSYLVPFLILVGGLVVFSSFHISELTAGCLSIAMLAPYYAILYLFRSRINERFVFTLNV